MPKLTNICAICGKPILKSRTLCPRCELNNQEAEKEIEREHARLIPELLWEKRRYEIAKNLYPFTLDGCRGNIRGAAKEAVNYANILIEELKIENRCTS